MVGHDLFAGVASSMLITRQLDFAVRMRFLKCEIFSIHPVGSSQTEGSGFADYQTHPDSRPDRSNGSTVLHATAKHGSAAVRVEVHHMPDTV